MRFATRAILVVAAVILATAAGAQAPRPGGGPRTGGGNEGGGGGGAPGGLIAQFDPDQIAQAITAAGFPSKVVLNNKVRMVQTGFWGDEIFSGAYGVYCNDKGACGGLKMFANTGKSSVGADWINAWNNRYFFVRTYQTDKGDLVFFWDVLLVGGVSPNNIAATATVFKSIVDQSTDFKP